MLVLSNATSLLELAFGVNAVFAAISGKFHFTRQRVAEAVAAQLREHVPDFKLQEHERPYFDWFVFQSVRGLRHASRINFIPLALSITMSAGALVGLTVAAIEPQTTVSTALLIGFTFVALVFAPCLYFLQERFLGWLTRLVIVEGAPTPAMASIFVKCFRDSQEMEVLGRKMEASSLETELAMHDMDQQLFRLRWRMFYLGARDKIMSLAIAVQKWHIKLRSNPLLHRTRRKRRADEQER